MKRFSIFPIMLTVFPYTEIWVFVNDSSIILAFPLVPIHIDLILTNLFLLLPENSVSSIISKPYSSSNNNSAISGLNPLAMAFITFSAINRLKLSSPSNITNPSLESMLSFIFNLLANLFLIFPFFPIKTAILSFGIFISYVYIFRKIQVHQPYLNILFFLKHQLDYAYICRQHHLLHHRQTPKVQLIIHLLL